MKASDIVNEYLAAYTSGDVDRAVALVTKDFSFQGPMQAATGRSALRKIVQHVATNARGYRVLRQWQDGDDVCTIYQFSIETGAEANSLLVSEWNTIRNAQVASSLMVFDTGPSRAGG